MQGIRRNNIKSAGRAMQRHPGGVILRVILCLLLVVAPIISPAAGGPLVGSPEHAVVEAGEHAAKPCCDREHDAEPDNTQTDHCQHCKDDVAQSACKCCSYTAPATAPLHSMSANTPISGSDDYQPQISAAPPNAPAGSPFRPPIRSI